MLSRRSLLAGTAAFAAGCGELRSTLSPPSLPQETEVNWAVIGDFLSLFDPERTLTSDKSVLQRGLAALVEDKENPYGPARGRYTIRLRYSKEWPEPDEQPKTSEEWLEDFAELLEDFSADLVALPPSLTRLMGEEGLVLPLDRFMGAEKSAIEAEFFPSVLESARGARGLYALPVGALPEMVTYDAEYFAKRGVPPVDSSWDWDDLVSNAERLTQRNKDGEVMRWGVVTNGGVNGGIWWALLQSEAVLLEPDTLECRLQELAALDAMQFFHDLVHTHRVSPPTMGGGGLRHELWSGVYPLFAMQYSTPALAPTTLDFPLAELPLGRARATTVNPDLYIAIAARTPRAEAAYMALRGVVGAMQQFVHVPAEREALARLGELRRGLLPNEVTAIQRSMEYGHPMPRLAVEYRAMDRMVWGLVRGDDVATVAGDVCNFVREYQRSCEENPLDIGCKFLRNVPRRFGTISVTPRVPR